MNAPENITSLRQEIAQHLASTGEATAKQIAEAILQEKVEVARALNDMHKSAEVEREKKRGNEYVYWLSAAAAAPKKAEAPKVVAVPSSHAADNDFSLLGVIADIRAAIGDKEGRIMLGDLAAAVGEIAEERSRLQAENVALKTLNEAMPGFGAEHQEQRIDSLTKDVINTRAALTKAINEADRLRRELTGAVDVADAAVGYLVKAPKLKPRRVTKPENAQAAALAAVRGGAARADVLALVPVGTARRGAEWQGIQPMAKGD